MSNAREVRSRIGKQLKKASRPRVSKQLQRLDSIEAHHTALARCAGEQRLGVLSRQLIRCTQCDKRSAMMRWGFVRIWHYGFDEWEPEQNQYCLIVCPKCKTPNRITVHPQRATIVKTLDGYRIPPHAVFGTMYKKLGDNAIVLDTK